ncbi:hypothetical protein [Henriciella pelagia]|uniref:hypothetical protein n=1 Tax=Henriciella pelagia TaxID=1977912 RepID=UPI003519CB53
MKYYLDCEFNGMGGELLSLALEPEAGDPLYLVRGDIPRDIEPWVRENVLPILHADNRGHKPLKSVVWDLAEWPTLIEEYLDGDRDITIVTDWPDDIKYFCELILTGPGQMIEIRPSLTFEMHRVDAYPTELPGAVQHCAFWDAKALKLKLETEAQL